MPILFILFWLKKYLVNVFLEDYKVKKKDKTKSNFKELGVLFLMLEVFGGISELYADIYGK